MHEPTLRPVLLIGLDDPHRTPVPEEATLQLRSVRVTMTRKTDLAAHPRHLREKAPRVPSEESLKSWLARAAQGLVNSRE